MEQENDSGVEARYFPGQYQGEGGNMLALRLDTDTVSKKIESQLRGQRLEPYKLLENGEMEYRILQMGEPIANELGIQKIMSQIDAVFNSQTVQGNFNDSRYEEFIINMRTQLTREIITNLYAWGMSDVDVDGLINSMMNLIEPFMSRTLDNTERDSYGMKGRMEMREIYNRPTNQKISF